MVLHLIQLESHSTKDAYKQINLFFIQGSIVPSQVEIGQEAQQKEMKMWNIDRQTDIQVDI